jgi:hypothetical protein
MITTIAGMPRFEIGEEAVLFDAGKDAISPLVGLHTGMFRLSADETGALRVFDSAYCPLVGIEQGYLKFLPAAKSGREVVNSVVPIKGAVKVERQNNSPALQWTLLALKQKIMDAVKRQSEDAKRVKGDGR